MFHELEEISRTSDDFSYGTSVFDALLCEEDGNRADETRNIMENNSIPKADIENDDSTVATDDRPAQPSVKNSGRICKEPVTLTYDLLLTDDEDADIADMFLAGEPAWFTETTNDERRDNWEKATVDDICALREHDMWEFVPPSTNNQSKVDCKWLYNL